MPFDWNVYRLRVFVRVAQTLNVSEAARQLCVAQPAISRYIKELEEAIGVRLFDRTARGLALTEEGLFLLHRARDVLAAVEAWDEAAKSVRRAFIGELTLAAMGSWERSLLGAIEQFTEAHPAVVIRLTVVGYAQVVDLALGNAIHLGFLAFDPPKEATLEGIPMGTDELVLVAAPDYTLVRSGPKSPSIGEPLPLVQVADEKLFPERVRDYLKRFGLKIRTVAQLQSAQLAKVAVCRGLGVGLLLKSQIATELARGELVPLIPDLPTCTVTLYAVRNLQRTFGPIQKAFLTNVADLIRSYGLSPR